MSAVYTCHVAILVTGVCSEQLLQVVGSRVKLQRAGVHVVRIGLL